MSKKEQSASGLTHIDAEGRARMVNVGEKAITHRVCVARCEVSMEAETLDLITSGRIPKGDVLATARIAGIQAAKKTGEWIPLAHPLPLDSVEIELRPEAPQGVLCVEARVETHWKTGVEMEALVAASASALTIYDMCKAVDRHMSVHNLRLSEKTGGKSGHFLREGERKSRMEDEEPA